MAMLGADVERLRVLGAQLDGAAVQLQDAFCSALNAVELPYWAGPDADRFRDLWRGPVRIRFGEAEALLRAAAGVLREQADQQERASARYGTGPSGEGMGPVGFGAVECRDPEMGGRQSLADLLALTDVGIGTGQILVKVLPDGSVIVVLPGLQDLTNSLKEGGKAGLIGGIRGGLPGAVVGGVVGAVTEAATTDGHARDLRYAVGTALNPGNADHYAAMVKQALEDAGIPPGTNVSIVGHSYGAYAASSLASDPSFNQMLGEGGQYRVTHVLAAAADVDQFMPRVAPGTRYLIVNNEGDAVVQGEQMAYAAGGNGSIKDRWLGTDGQTGTHSEEWFKGGTGKDVGHSPSRYVEHIRNGEMSDTASAFFESFDKMYQGEGTDSNRHVPG